jgi:putative hydrolase of the HAD superfamily
MLRLITFDFWQTLLADTPASMAAAHELRLAGVRKALAGAGRIYDDAALATGDQRALAVLDAIWQTHRDIPPAEHIRIFLDALEPGLPAALTAETLDAAAAAYAAPVLTHGPAVSPGAVDAIRALADRGVALGIISNTGRTPGTMLRRILAQAGVPLEVFRVFSFSDEVGARKPAEAIFRRTLAAADCAPAAALHIGDDPVTDVAGARAIGMRALHYVPDGRPCCGGADAALRDFAELAGLLDRFH